MVNEYGLFSDDTGDERIGRLRDEVERLREELSRRERENDRQKRQIDQAKCTSVCGRARSAVAERTTTAGI